ncbi:MAG: Tfp pilus assembly protein FimT/FimU [Bryobacteraceae bacterium]
MPISSVGRHNRGVTLLEMVVVVAIIGLLVGITFPAVATGLDTIRLSSATDSIASFLNGGLNRCERRQEVVEVSVSVRENALWLRSSEPGFERRLEMPEGIRIEAVHPRMEPEPEARSFILAPGGAVPRFGVQLANRRGGRRIVRVDPMTGVPRVERVE